MIKPNAPWDRDHPSMTQERFEEVFGPGPHEDRSVQPLTHQTKTCIHAGEKITLENLSGRIFNTQYIPVRESNMVIGKIAKRKILKGEPLNYELLG